MTSKAKDWALLGAIAGLVCPAAADTERRTLQDHEIVADQELLITAPEVVDGPQAQYPGPWSFGHLATEAFGEDLAPFAVKQWLERWAEGQAGSKRQERLAPRPHLHKLVIEPWMEADGAEHYVAWEPNFENAPFQLLAIANRMDLSVPLPSFNNGRLRRVPRSGAAYYGSSTWDADGGEGRLVFAVTDQAGEPLDPGVTLIFEYALDLGGEQERLHDWAMAWHELGSYQSFDADYRAALSKVTRAFTDRRNSRVEQAARDIKKPEELRDLSLLDRLRIGTGSMPTQLMRVRTNDGAFGEIREFREFAWSLRGFTPAPLAGTPREPFFRAGSKENRWLAQWVRAEGLGERTNAATAREDEVEGVPTTFVLPAEYRSRQGMVPVVAMSSPVVGNDDSYHWDGGRVLPYPEVRRAFSMQTCCGCHCGDTNTRFFHVGPRDPGTEAPLSRFLRVDRSQWQATDPATRMKVPSSEMALRVKLFKALLHPDLDDITIMELQESRRARAH